MVSTYELICSQTLGRPTTRDLSRMMCKHRKWNPQKTPYPHQLLTHAINPKIQSIDRIEACSECLTLEETLNNRRQEEERKVLALDAASASRDHGAAWYFISSKWLKLWGNFVKGGDLPGAITNDFVDKTGKGLRNMRKGNRDSSWHDASANSTTIRFSLPCDYGRDVALLTHSTWWRPRSETTWHCS